MENRSNAKDDSISLKRRILSLPTLLSFAVAVALVYFLATRFDLDWGKTWDNVRTMNPWLYGLALGLYYLSFVFRGLRWQVLARNAGIHDRPGASLPSVLRFSQLIIIGWFVNAIAALRLGDAYRAYAFSEDSGREFSWGLGTVLAERAVDMATVLGLVVIGVGLFSATRGSSGTGYVLVGTFLLAMALGALLAMMKGYGTRLARFLPGRLQQAYHQFHKGAMGSFKQLRVVFALGLVGWLLEAGRLYFVVQALDLTISLPLVLIVALAHAILSIVPTPGGVGAVEPGMTTLLVLGLERHDALSVALVDRSITYVSVIVFGGLAFLQWQASRGRRRRESLMAGGAAS